MRASEHIYTKTLTRCFAVLASLLWLAEACRAEIELPCYFPDPNVSREYAAQIINSLRTVYDSERYWGDFWGAGRALMLLGKPGGVVALDGLTISPRNMPVSDACVGAIRLLGYHGLIDLKDPCSIATVRKFFKTAVAFPSDDDLSRISSAKEKRDLFRRAVWNPTCDAHRVIAWYLNELNGRIRSGDMSGPEFFDASGDVGALQIPPPVMLATPYLAELVINPSGGQKWRTKQDERVATQMRQAAMRALAENYTTFLTGAVYLGMTQDGTEAASDYVQVAADSRADMDAHLVERLLASCDSGRCRVQIARALGKTGDRGYRRLLRPLLADDNHDVRITAVTSLAYLGDDIGLDMIKEDINDFEFSSSKYSYCIEALGKLGTNAACELLCSQLDRYTSQKKRWYPGEIVSALHDSANSSIVSQLFGIRDESGNLREYIADAIRAVADKKALPALASHLEDKDTAAVKLAADLIVQIAGLNIGEGQNSVDTARQWAVKHSQGDDH